MPGIVLKPGEACPPCGDPINLVDPTGFNPDVPGGGGTPHPGGPNEPTGGEGGLNIDNCSEDQGPQCQLDLLGTCLPNAEERAAQRRAADARAQQAQQRRNHDNRFRPGLNATLGPPGLPGFANHARRQVTAMGAALVSASVTAVEALIPDELDAVMFTAGVTLDGPSPIGDLLGISAVLARRRR